ncbi:hypothetical protein BKA66DRAFT_437485 [Pyrenochaeta sp. MPI-SDFR-AT-0127]|nr:hypothetical protein BKA66DRAFT_437485 [Pyrenochaeta sp. MPI-SDFR-AT-0127]
MRPVEKVRKQANSSRVKAASKSLGSSCTRKKGLLMHRLALLRTTTPNGLPEPHDTNAVNAPLITDVDPIDDRQTFASLRSNQHGSVSDYDFVSAAKVVSFPMANRTQRYNSPRVKPEKTPASFTQQLPVSTRSRQQPHAVQGGFDGFMGSELEFVSKRRAIRPGHHPMTKKKKPANEVGAKLALASGLLPIPAAENLQEPVFTEHSGVLLNQDNIF